MANSKSGSGKSPKGVTAAGKAAMPAMAKAPKPAVAAKVVQPVMFKPVLEVAKPVLEVAKPVPEVAKPVPEVAKPMPEVAKPMPEVAKPVPEVAKPMPEIAKPVPVAVKAPATKAPAPKAAITPEPIAVKPVIAPPVQAVKPAISQPVKAEPVKSEPVKSELVKSAPLAAAPPVETPPIAEIAPVIATPPPALPPASAPEPVPPVLAPAPPIAVPEPVAPTPIPAASPPILASVFPLSIFKELIMDTTDYTASLKTGLADMQEKAKAAYEKGTASLGDYNDFTKGNVEAMVESSKILASGLQEMSTTMVAESRSVFETLTADVKELAAVKSPTEFVRLQGEMIRKIFDGAVSFSSKHTEAMLKLANDSAAPLSTRVNLAVEKVKTTA